MAGLKLSSFLALLLLVGCNGCDPNAPLTRVCPDQIHNVYKETDVIDADKDGFAPCALDCDDNDPTVFPGSIERCNGVDDDCDGIIDGMTMKCWSRGPKELTVPLTQCHAGTSSCTNGSWSKCVGEKFPSREICDGVNNDCDDEVDESTPGSCGPESSLGACSKGTLVCAENESFCVDAVYPSNETCNNVDDDCDGIVDEDLDRRCLTACGDGIETCRVGSWVECSAPTPESEICDSLDNDCNGLVDDGITCACRWSENQFDREIKLCIGPPLTCGRGISECQRDGTWGECIFLSPAIEQCNNWDDDCDGIVDTFEAGCGNQATAGVGVCRLGVKECNGGQWSQCIGEIAPTSEVCNQLDDDCDGQTDEDLDPHERAAILFLIDGSGSMCNVMIQLQTAIAIYAADFRGTDHRFALAVFPGRGNGVNVDVITPMVDIDAFLLALSTITCSYGGDEPGYTASWLAMSPVDVLGIGWPKGNILTGEKPAYPYVIAISDEFPNQEIQNDPHPLGRTILESDVADAALSCSVGACVAGDHFETFVLTLSALFGLWDAPTYFEPNRLAELSPVDVNRYVDVFRGIFQNVCL